MLKGIYKTTEIKKFRIKRDFTEKEILDIELNLKPGQSITDYIEPEITFTSGQTISEYWKQYADEYFNENYLDSLDKISKEKNMSIIDVIQFIDILLDYRKNKRLEKNWSESDRVRNLLDEMNVFVFDLPKGQYMTYFLDDSFFKWLEVIGDVKLKKDVYIFRSRVIQDESTFKSFTTKRKYVEYVLEQERQAEARQEAWLYTMQESIRIKKDNK